MENIKKYKTNQENLLFIGFDGYEEYYLDMDSENFKGWSFMGLRPETEENLREYMRNVEPEDMGLNVPQELYKYFDYQSFHDDMEEDWYDHYDVQAERISDDGEIIYLGFGSGQDIYGYFDQESINNYNDYCDHFDIIGLSEKEFYLLMGKLDVKMKFPEDEYVSEINLVHCKEGDILISKHGTVLEYIRPTTETEYLDHKVKYLDYKLGGDSYGTRSNNGQTFIKKRLDTDEDIVKAIQIE